MWQAFANRRRVLQRRLRSTLEAEVAVLKTREAEQVTSQADIIQAVVEKLFRFSRFSYFASRLGSILSIPVRAATLDAVAKKYTDLDKAEFGYETRTDEELLSSYGATIVEYVGTFPLIHKLTSSTELLTPEAVLVCEVDEFLELKNAIAELGQGEEQESEEERDDVVSTATEKQKEAPELEKETDQGGVNGSLA